MNKLKKIFEASVGTQSVPSSQVKPEVRVKFSVELQALLKKLEDEHDYVAFELLWLGEPDSKYYNGLKINYVDISKQKGCFDIKIGYKKTTMGIKKFIKYFFGETLGDRVIEEFINNYSMSSVEGDVEVPNKIEKEEFKFNPTNVRSTFLSMVTKTYPHGHEKEVLQFLPDLEEDSVGNYYKIIGENPTTMFTSHLDTVDRKQVDTNLFSKKDENGDEIIYTDGNTILGADDKAGVAVMLYMMANNVPGLYYFFMGEERGCIGSGKLSNVYEKTPYLKDIKRCVSFDRRDVCSVITSQLYRVCCSDQFATALCKEYNSNGLNLSLDPTGILTDSATFLDQIAECTNISVGYYNEHTGREKQNITYLEKLAKASVQVNWSDLPTIRKIGISEEAYRKYNRLINDIKKSPFDIEVKVVSEEGWSIDGLPCEQTIISCDLQDGSILETYESLSTLQFLLDKHKINKTAYFEGDYIKIELS